MDLFTVVGVILLCLLTGVSVGVVTWQLLDRSPLRDLRERVMQLEERVATLESSR